MFTKHLIYGATNASLKQRATCSFEYGVSRSWQIYHFPFQVKINRKRTDSTKARYFEWQGSRKKNVRKETPQTNEDMMTTVLVSNCMNLMCICCPF